ncbi:PREDICTED: 28S ribosomal protein S18c, mitochondrial [Cariama cristata]|uniref:28S ribosomal protein S18c, mitochondrial n=1 Tax=Cariama cristata TaxID=54380 RepID=UPI00051FF676|nr:PREDICTED: 28S ribosomal protein S18c, mitochondrial [Cariama cristata]
MGLRGARAPKKLEFRYFAVTDQGRGAEGGHQPIQMENPYKEPPKKCVLCGIKVDYKNVQLLSQFVSPHTGCIYGRHITGLCNKKQKEITKAIKRAHVLGFMPVMFKNPSFLTDPKICNVKYPE